MLSHHIVIVHYIIRADGTGPGRAQGHGSQLKPHFEMEFMCLTSDFYFSKGKNKLILNFV